MHIQGKTHQVLKYCLMLGKLCWSLDSVNSGKKEKYLFKLHKKLQEDVISTLLEIRKSDVEM